ncbi:hypothetical protein ACYOEI_40225, partial [Singulisphaera rosea]
MIITMRPTSPSLRDALAVAELFVGVFRRDLLAFYPQCGFEPVDGDRVPVKVKSGPDFHLAEDLEDPDGSLQVEMFGRRHRLTS